MSPNKSVTWRATSGADNAGAVTLSERGNITEPHVRAEERRVAEECVTTCRYVTGVQTCAPPIYVPQQVGHLARHLRSRQRGSRDPVRTRQHHRSSRESGRASCRGRVCNDVSIRDWSSDVCSSDLCPPTSRSPGAPPPEQTTREP